MQISNHNRIALVTDKFELGGGLKHIQQIVRGIPELEFGVFAQDGKDSGTFKGIENVTIFNKGFSPDYILKFNPAIIHFHHLKPLFKNYLHSHSNGLIPIIFTVHGMHIHKYKFLGGYKNKIKYNLRYILEKSLFNYAQEIITVSQEDKQFIEINYHRNNCHFIPNGISLNGIDKITNSKEALRNKLKFPLNSKLFLTVARFNFQKGYDILVKAIAQAKDQLANKKIRFILVGEGEEKNNIIQLSHNLNVIKQIDFLGRRNDIYEIMKACDYFISSSRWEGLPITLIEAALCRLPMIASDTYGNREIVSNNDNGILFQNLDCKDLAQKITLHANGNNNLIKKVNNAYEFANRFYNNHQMINKLNAIYSNYL